MAFGGVGGSFGNNPSKGMSGTTRTITYGPEGNPNFPGTVAYNKAHGISGGWSGAASVAKAAPAKSQAPAAPAGPDWSQIAGYYNQALGSLSGDAEKMYQQGKRRSLADIAMQSVNAGMANTLNMPAANVAYDEANRPAFNTMLGQQKANILTGLGQTAAGVYGQNLGAQTQRYGIDVGAASDAASRALQQYIANLNANVTQQGNLLDYSAAMAKNSGGSASYTGSLNKV